MKANAVLQLLLFLSHVAGVSPQDPRPLPQRIDGEVARISGFPREGPAPRCDDGEFLRRVMLDLVGYPPTADETRAFVADRAENKRDAIVDRLLTSERFADFWARRWMGVFFGNPAASTIPGVDAEIRDEILERFRRWLAGRISRDWAWTETVQDLLIAEGTPDVAPSLAYKLVLDAWPRAPYLEGRAVAHFMAIDFGCAGCHDHPFDNWTIDDAYSIGAFSTGRKVRWGPKGIEVLEGPEPPNRPVPGDKGFMADLGNPLGVKAPKFPRAGRPAAGEVLSRAFARMMIAPENVSFRTAFVNRVWLWLLGRGIVASPEDFNKRHPPLATVLLNQLAGAFAANGHSLKFLIRAICATETYQRRCDGPTPYMRVNFSRTQIRPLTPEQLLQSIEVATLGKPRFDRALVERLAYRMTRGHSAICETSPRTPDVRALAWLADSEDVWSLIREGPIVQGFVRMADAEACVQSMFLSALSRDPGPRELARYAAFLKGRGEDGVREAYWTLLLSSEFLTRH